MRNKMKAKELQETEIKTGEPGKHDVVPYP